MGHARTGPQEDTVSLIQSASDPGSSALSPRTNRAHRPARVAALGLALALALAVIATDAPPSLALGNGPATMEILVDGRPVTEYAARGASYIEALAGREYAVRLTKRTDRRIAVALSVDGLNSIDAKTTSAADATKWVLGPYESITIDGWQTSAQTARKFFFTTESRSYGAWLGKTRNLGVIAAAVFRERLPMPRPLCGDRIPCPYDGGRYNEDSRSRDKAERRQSTAPSQAPEPQAEAAPPYEQSQAQSDEERKELGSLGYSGSAGKLRKDDDSKRQLSDELAATGIGR